MDDTRREELKARRAALKDRLELAPINALIERLAERGCRAEILFPEQNRMALGELVDAPGKDERIDWSLVPTGACRAWRSEEERDDRAREALRLCAGPDASVAIIWNPVDPGLMLSRPDVEAVIDLLLDEATETWLVDAAGGTWLIECSIFDREICWSTDLMRGLGQTGRSAGPRSAAESLLRP